MHMRIYVSEEEEEEKKVSKKITALRVPRLSPTLVLSKPEGA